MQPRKLLMISTDRKIFQEGSSVRARQMAYAKDWQEVHIIIFDKKNQQGTDGRGSTETVVSPNCWAYSTQSHSRYRYPLDAIRLGKFIIQNRHITHITCQDPFFTAISGVSLKKTFNIPLEIQLHTDIGSQHFPYSWGNKIRKIMALSYIQKADTIRTVSDKVGNYLKDYLKIDPSKISIQPVTVDVDRIVNEPVVDRVDLHKKYPQFSKIVLMASRLEKEKNIGLAIKSWKKVMENISEAGLVIVGEGSKLSFIQSQIQDLGLQKNIIIEPWADMKTLISYYKTADIFLNTSLYEGYGMTLVEAEAAGCKVISTDVGVAAQIGADIVKYDPHDVADKIIRRLS